MSNRKGKGTDVSRTQLAEFFGVAAPTVDHWVRMGCPYVERGGKGKPWTFNTADVSAWRIDKAKADATGSAPADEAELKLRALAAKTAQAELELARARGEVAPVEQMRRAMQSAFAEVKANMRNVPSRAVRMLIGETDEVRFKRVLLEEIDHALGALAEADLIDEDAIEDFDDEGDE
jgi:terminase small subunit / prophage DNA-packing protein